MFHVKHWVYLLALAMTLTVVAGCASQPEQQQDIMTRAAVITVVGRYIRAADDPAQRADRVHAVAETIQGSLDGSQSITVDALEEAARAEVPWERLAPEEKILIDSLIESIRIEVDHRVDEGVISVDEQVEVAAVIEWILEGANLYRE